jgi:hypothetical protein
MNFVHQVALRVAVALVATDAESAAQQNDTVRIPYRIACPQCQLVVEKVAVIGKPTDPVLLSEFFVLDRDSKGRFLTIGAGNDQLIVFDSTGRFQTALGRRGDGPGEFGGAEGVREVRIGAGDTIYALDGRRKVHIFSPSYRYVREVDLLGGPIRMFPLQNGALVISAAVPTPKSYGFPFHVVERDGSISVSFGPEQRNIVRDSLTPDMIRARGGVRGRRGGVSLDEASRPTAFELSYNKRSIIVQRQGRYVFHTWGVDGRDLGVVEVVGAPWLPSPGSVPAAALASVNFAGTDQLGHYLVVGSVPSLPTTQPTDARLRRFFVEVLDLNSRQVLMSASVPEAIRMIHGTPFAFSKSTDSSGVVSFTVWRVSVRRALRGTK